MKTRKAPVIFCMNYDVTAALPKPEWGPCSQTIER